MEAGLGAFRFTRLGPHWVVDVNVPELAVAYEEDYARKLFEGPRAVVHHPPRLVVGSYRHIPRAALVP
jgi:hypothetical protein